MKNDKDDHDMRSTVIVAERYPLSRAALADLLATDGYRVFQFDNANSASSCVDQNTNLAVLLADLDMPGWKSLIRHTLIVAPQVLIIGMLGAQSYGDDLDLKKRGIGSCLPKPIVYRDLQDLIRFKDQQHQFSEVKNSA
jgi:DNA-binding NtrC family response regulator